MLKDYQRASKDFDKGNFLEPNNAFILQSHGDVKNLLKDYETTLEDLDNEGAKNSFTSKVRILGLIQHINLVRFLGYCIQGLDHMLVYEYMSNKSLDKLLSRDTLLNWNNQMSIIIGVAQGLAYLHHKCNLAIVHLDIELGNILLDKDYTPK
jgi:serine/threonine protein kinase